MRLVAMPPPSHTPTEVPVVASLQSLVPSPVLSPMLQLKKHKQTVQLPVQRKREQRGCGVGSQEWS